MIPFSHFVSGLVMQDVTAYRRLIESKGGQLGDGVISALTAVARLTAFVTMLYAAIGGRCDFWPLMEAYQVGFGSKVYSFHGLEATLVNGPIWGINGLLVGNNQKILFPMGFPDAPLTVVSVDNTTPWFDSIGANVHLTNHAKSGSVRGFFFPGYRRQVVGFCDGVFAGFDYRGSSNFQMNYWNMKEDGETFAGRYSTTEFPEALSVTNWNVLPDGGPIGIHAEATVPFNLPFFALWDKYTQSQSMAVYSAYKSTLGKELGLA